MRRRWAFVPTASGARSETSATYSGNVTLFDQDGAKPAGDLCTANGLIFLQRLPGVGPVKAVRLAKAFGDLSALRAASAIELTASVGSIAGDVHAELRRRAEIAQPESESEAVCCFDSHWPQWLSDLRNPPAVLFYRGSLPKNPSIAVVGTRSPTAFGLSVVEKVAKSARDHGWGIVSGLALGIDGAAHEAALAEGAPTWAILGGGVERPTPKKNRDLADEIVRSGGGLVSEQPDGTEPNAQRLVARNRLQAAASRVVLVAQCGIPSGTLHTARFALEQNRLLAVPRPRGRWAAEPESAGNLALTDPEGCDPGIVNASGALSKRLRTRRPLADLVLENAGDMELIWR